MSRIPTDSRTPLILLSEVKPRINAKWPQGDVNNRVLDMIIEVSQSIQGMCGRCFDEYVDTRYYTPFHISAGGDLFGLRELMLDADLKSYTSIINGDGSTIAPGNVKLEPFNSPYKSIVRLNPYGVQFWYHAGVTDPRGSISVTGTWGYGGQWVNPGAGTLASGLTDTTGTTLTCTDATKLEVGMTLSLTTAGGLAEYLSVTAVPGVPTGTVTVQRGFNGSTAVAHAAAEPIYRWKSNDVVRQVVTRLLMVWLEQDSSPLFGQSLIGDMPFPMTVDSVPKDVLQLILSNKLRRTPRIQAV